MQWGPCGPPATNSTSEGFPPSHPSVSFPPSRTRALSQGLLNYSQFCPLLRKQIKSKKAARQRFESASPRSCSAQAAPCHASSKEAMFGKGLPGNLHPRPPAVTGTDAPRIRRSRLGARLGEEPQLHRRPEAPLFPKQKNLIHLGKPNAIIGSLKHFVLSMLYRCWVMEFAVSLVCEHQ